MKKTLLKLGAFLILSAIAWGSDNYSKESKDVTVKIKIVKPITLTLSQADIDFGNVAQEDNAAELAGLNTVTMNVTGADASTLIDFYIDDKDGDDTTTGEVIVLDNGGNTISSTLKLTSIQETTNASGEASSTIDATIAANAISGTTVLGEYSKAISVYAEYN